MARKTNIEALTDLMEFSDYGPLAQAFVIDAVLKHAELIANMPQAEFEEKMKSSMVAPASWQGVAREIAGKLNAHLNGDQQPLPSTPLDALSALQKSALIDFRDTHGQQWKSALREGWHKAAYPGALQQIRNTHGPEWLAKVKDDHVIAAKAARAKWLEQFDSCLQETYEGFSLDDAGAYTSPVEIYRKHGDLDVEEAVELFAATYDLENASLKL